MGMDSDTGSSAEMHHGYTIFCLGCDLPTKHHHQVELWENLLWLCHLGRTDLCLVETCCCTGEGGSVLLQTRLLSGVLECHIQGSLGLTGLSSSEPPITKWWYTGLQHLNLWGECTRCCSAVVSGVIRLKDKFSLIDTWHIQGALLRGVGMFKLSLPLS